MRSAKVRPGPLRTIALGRLYRSRYRVRIDRTDRAGNPANAFRTIRFR